MNSTTLSGVAVKRASSSKNKSQFFIGFDLFDNQIIDLLFFLRFAYRV